VKLFYAIVCQLEMADLPDFDHARSVSQYPLPCFLCGKSFLGISGLIYHVSCDSEEKSGESNCLNGTNWDGVIAYLLTWSRLRLAKHMARAYFGQEISSQTVEHHQWLKSELLKPGLSEETSSSSLKQFCEDFIYSRGVLSFFHEAVASIPRMKSMAKSLGDEGLPRALRGVIITCLYHNGRVPEIMSRRLVSTFARLLTSK
jgi:hypothetical protein